MWRLVNVYFDELAIAERNQLDHIAVYSFGAAIVVAILPASTTTNA